MSFTTDEHADRIKKQIMDKVFPHTGMKIECRRRSLPKPEVPYPFIRKTDVGKAVYPSGKFEDHVPAVMDDSRCHIEEPVSDRLEEFLLVDSRECQPLDPVYQVIGDHPDHEIRSIGMKLLAGKLIQGKTILGLPDEVLHGGPLKMEGNKICGLLGAVGDDHVISVIDQFKERQLFLLRKLFPSDQKTILLRPFHRLIGHFCHPDMVIDLYPGVIFQGMDFTHHRSSLIGSDGKSDTEPFALGNDLFVVETGIHGDIDCIGQAPNLVVALPDETLCPVRGINVAGTEPAMEPIPILPDETHQRIQCPNPRIGHPSAFLLTAVNLIQGRIDIQGDDTHFIGNRIHFPERLGNDTFQLSDMTKIEPPEKVSHGRGMRYLTVTPYGPESLFLSQDKQIIQTFTPGDHAGRQTEDRFRFPVSPFPFFHRDCPVNEFGKSQSVDKLIQDNASTETDQGIVSFYKDNLLPAGNLHLHLLGDQDDVTLIGRKPVVHMNFKELDKYLPVH